MVIGVDQLQWIGQTKNGLQKMQQHCLMGFEPIPSVNIRKGSHQDQSIVQKDDLYRTFIIMLIDNCN